MKKPPPSHSRPLRCAYQIDGRWLSRDGVRELWASLRVTHAFYVNPFGLVLTWDKSVHGPTVPGTEIECRDHLLRACRRRKFGPFTGTPAWKKRGAK